jgi:hypothetical protein
LQASGLIFFVTRTGVYSPIPSNLNSTLPDVSVTKILKQFYTDVTMYKSKITVYCKAKVCITFVKFYFL